MSEYEQGSIEADIQAALSGGVESPVIEGTAKVIEAAEPPAPAVEEPSDGRVRDEHGRFVAKPEKTDTVEPQTPAPEAPQEPIQPKLSPPASWKAAAKAKFNALDPDVQAEVLRREQEMDQGRAQWETKAERANRMDAILAPHKDRLALAGVDEYQYLGALMKADEMLRGPNAMDGLAQVARMYGLQLPGPQQDQNGYQPQVQQDPIVQQLQQQVQGLSQQLQQFSTSQEEALMAEVGQEIEAFRANPEHIYFENVRPEMKALIESGRAKDLAEAYDKACWADPEVRKILLAEQAKPAAKVPTRPAGAQITGSPGPGASKLNGQVNPSSSLEDDVRAAMAELTGRV